MSSSFSPINVVLLGTGGILLFSASANRSPVNVIKASLGLEESKTLPPIKTASVGSVVKEAVVEVAKEGAKQGVDTSLKGGAQVNKVVKENVPGPKGVVQVVGGMAALPFVELGRRFNDAKNFFGGK